MAVPESFSDKPQAIASGALEESRSPGAPSISSEQGIQAAYNQVPTRQAYVEERFSSELNRLLHDRQVGSVQRLIEQVQPGHILEIAPGPGRLTKEIRPTKTYVCLEYNECMIGPGRRACDPNIAWVRGNGFQLPFATGFDFVFSFRFVRHFRYKDRDRLYREIGRVLKSGGWFMMDAVNARVSEPLRRARPEEYPIFDELYEPQQLLDELASAGLEPVSLVPVQKWYTWQYRSQTLLGPRSAWLNRFVIRGLEMLPRADGLEWIVTCRRP